MEEMFRPGGFSITDRAMSFCGFQKGDTLLDIGCGKGATVHRMRELYGCDAVGIDLQPQADMLQGRAEELPFDDASADGIFFECSFSLTKAEAALREAARVLRARGYLVISDVYARGEEAELNGILKHVRTKENLLALLEKNGFRCVLFEDYTRELTSMMIQMIMDDGCDALYGCLGASPAQMKQIKAGYCLIVARKVKSPVEEWTLRQTGQDLQCYFAKKEAEVCAYAAEHSVFYRNRLQDPLDTTTSAHDIARDSNAFLCKRPDEICRIVTLQTSGTQGKPKRLFFSQADLELTVSFFRVGMSTMVQRGDKVMILMPCSIQYSIGDLLRRALEQLGCQSVLYGPISDYADAARTAREEKPDCMVGIPAQVLRLAREAEDLRPKTVLLSADYLANSMRKAIESAWGCEVFEHYGSVEMGLGGGVECACHCGYHMRHGDMHYEIVHPETGEPMPNGQYGEVVFTTLTRDAMPLIRYRTGDISRILEEPCPCGSVLPRLDKVIGRKENLKDRISIHALDEQLFTHEEILDYNAEWVDDTLRIKVELKRPEALEAVRTFIQSIVQAEVVLGTCGHTTGVQKRKIERYEI